MCPYCAGKTASWHRLSQLLLLQVVRRTLTLILPVISSLILRERQPRPLLTSSRKNVPHFCRFSLLSVHFSARCAQYALLRCHLSSLLPSRRTCMPSRENILTTEWPTLVRISMAAFAWCRNTSISTLSACMYRTHAGSASQDVAQIHPQDGFLLMLHVLDRNLDETVRAILKGSPARDRRFVLRPGRFFFFLSSQRFCVGLAEVFPIDISCVPPYDCGVSGIYLRRFKHWKFRRYWRPYHDLLRMERRCVRLWFFHRVDLDHVIFL